MSFPLIDMMKIVQRDQERDFSFNAKAEKGDPVEGVAQRRCPKTTCQELLRTRIPSAL
jgi:hypothetical protein